MTKKPGVAIASLAVDRDELLEGLQRLKRHANNKKLGPGAFRFQGGRLHVDVESMEITARGIGQWTGEAVVPGASVLAFASNAPDDDPMPLREEADRLHEAKASIRCCWLHRGDAPAENPVVRASPAGFPLLEILRVAGNQSHAALQQSGFLSLVRDARRERDARSDAAANQLGVLGVTRHHVVRLADQSLRTAAISGAGDSE